jgi:hypothetical protein
MKDTTPNTETAKFSLGDKKPMRNNMIKAQFVVKEDAKPSEYVKFSVARTVKIGNDSITVFSTPFGEMISSSDLRSIVAHTMPREKYVYSSLFRMYNNHIGNYAFKKQTNMVVHEGVYYFNINAFQCITERFREIDAYKDMDWGKLQKACEKVYGILPEGTSHANHHELQMIEVKATPVAPTTVVSANIESITSIIAKEHTRTADENMALNVKIRNGLKQTYGDVKEIDDTYIAIMAYGYNSFDAYRELLPILDSRVHSHK